MEPKKCPGASPQVARTNRGHGSMPFMQVGMAMLLLASSIACPGDTPSPVAPQQGDIVVRITASKVINGWPGFEDPNAQVSVYKNLSGATEGSVVELTDPVVSWQSSNTSVVALVNDQSVNTRRPRIRFVGVGSAVLTATLNDPRLTLAAGVSGTATIPVTVSDPPVSIKVTPNTATILTGKELRVSVTGTTAKGVRAVGTVGGYLRMSCSGAQKCSKDGIDAISSRVLTIPDEGYSVDTSFIVKGYNPGTVVLTIDLMAVTPDGIGKLIGTDAIAITVQDPPRPVRVTIGPPLPSVFVGGTKQLTAIAYDAQGNPVSSPQVWSTKDAILANVNSAGLVTALSTGSGSPVSAVVQIAVNAGPGIDDVANVTIYKQIANVLVTPNPKEMVIGSTQQFAASRRDNNNAVIPPESTPITWSTGNIAIATIDQNGLVTARATGTTTVIAKTAEGTTGVADLTVVAPPPSPVVRVVVTPVTITLKLSDVKCQFTAKAYDANGIEVIVPGFRWIVDVSPVASVDQNGLVTFKSAGTTAIRAFVGNAADAPGGFGTLTITDN